MKEIIIKKLQELDMDEAGELSEDMLDAVAGGGKIWEWIKDRFGRWFKKRSEKNTRDLDDILRGL